MWYIVLLVVLLMVWLFGKVVYEMLKELKQLFKEIQDNGKHL